MLITNISKNQFSKQWDVISTNKDNDKQFIKLSLDENFDVLSVENTTKLSADCLAEEINIIQSHLLEISTFSKTENLL